MTMALSGVINLVAPLAVHPDGARTKTTATPAAAQSFRRRGKKYSGALARVRTLSCSSACRRRTGFHGAQEIAAASISPRRSHAEIDPNLDENVGEVRKAVSLIELS